MPFIVLLFLTLSVFVGIPSASAQDWGCGGPCNTYDAMQNYGYTPDYGYTPGQNSHNQSLNSQPYDYGDSGFNSGADYCCDFSFEEERDARIEQRNWQLQNLYQNQKSIACGPPMSPRAREGC